MSAIAKATKYVEGLLNQGGRDKVVSIDIGSTQIKIAQLDLSGKKPKLLAFALIPSPKNAVNNNGINVPEKTAEAINKVISEKKITVTKAAFALPGPSAFTKKVTVPLTDLKSLQKNIQFEASNYIPHNLNAVRFDYQVVNKNSNSTMDILLVAVKNEIVSSFSDTIAQAGLQPAIADTDCFAMENCLEITQAKLAGKVVVALNIGARYTGVNIINDGISFFTGDISTGCKLYNDAIGEALGMQPQDVEEIKRGVYPEGCDVEKVNAAIKKVSEQMASELHRQIGFFWSAASTSKGIDRIFITGGGASIPQLIQEIKTKTGIECEVIDPFANIEIDPTINAKELKEAAPFMAVALGLASRKTGDKIHAIT